MKQSAVEWLVEQVETIVFYSEEAKENTIEQAKEMEKQQIIDAWNDGNNRYSGIGDSETYLEQFKKK